VPMTYRVASDRWPPSRLPESDPSAWPFIQYETNRRWTRSPVERTARQRSCSLTVSCRLHGAEYLLLLGSRMRKRNIYLVHPS
jgi:hypothetical protein